MSMRKLYAFREDSEMVRISNETYEDFFAALKRRPSNGQSFLNDKEIDALHDLLCLLRRKAIRTGWMKDEKDER